MLLPTGARVRTGLLVLTSHCRRAVRSTSAVRACDWSTTFPLRASAVETSLRPARIGDLWGEVSLRGERSGDSATASAQ